MTPSEVRLSARSGAFTSPTCGVADGFVQTNLAIIPQEYAYDFLLFCQRNPKPCPLLEVHTAGDSKTSVLSEDADVRTDLPKYRVYKEGELVDEPTSIENYWRDDLVAFHLGCSFSFENALQQAGIPIRHIDEGVNVPMYKTNIQNAQAGVFGGNMVVSMRPMKPSDAIRAVEITSRFPRVHGAPIHLGDPSAIGITDISKPDFGDTVTINPSEVAVFWACGVTPQAALMDAKLPFAITHAPGYMFVTDKKDADLEG